MLPDANRPTVARRALAFLRFPKGPSFLQSLKKYALPKVALVALFLGVAFTVLAFTKETNSATWFQALGLMLLNIATTVLVLDRLGERRYNRILKENLIQEMRSRERSFAIHALEGLRAKDWHSDGSLNGGVFTGAALAGANLEDAHLQKATLCSANLEDAKLSRADLTLAVLTEPGDRGIVLPKDLRSTNFDGVSAEGVDLSHTQLAGSTFRDAKLAHAKLPNDLRHVDLTGADLSQVDLSSVKGLDTENFSRVILLGATLPHDLRGAKLPGATLDDADLAGRDLREAILSGASLVHADLTGAGLEGAKLDAAKLPRAILTGARLNGASLREAELARADLTDAKLNRAKLRDAQFTRATLTNTEMPEDLRSVEFRHAFLTEVSLEGSDLRGARFDHATFVNVTFPIKLKQVVFSDAKLRRMNLKDRKLVEVVLSRTDLTGCDLDGARLTCVHAKAAVFDDATMISTVVGEGTSITEKSSFAGTTMEETTFVKCTLSDISLANVKRFDGVKFRASTLQNLKLPSDIANVQFLEETKIRDSELVGVSGVEVMMDGVHLAARGKSRFSGVRAVSCRCSFSFASSARGHGEFGVSMDSLRPASDIASRRPQAASGRRRCDRKAPARPPSCAPESPWACRNRSACASRDRDCWQRPARTAA